MSYFSLHAYDADVWLREFRGLNQADIEMNPDIRFAAEAENVETIHGVLQPQPPMTVVSGEFSSRVETLAVLHRRWYNESGSKDWYICSAGGKLYQKHAKTNEPWAEIELPLGVTNYKSSLWSCVTYEVPGGEGEPPVDVLIMSNAIDGMIMIVPPDVSVTWGTVNTTYTWGDLQSLIWAQRSDDDPAAVLTQKWSVQPINDIPYKFGVIERFQERIWGAAILDEPDLLAFSRPYDPTDWSGPDPDEPPEDGGGEVRQPSWDGDKFFGLKRFGDQLLAFKKNKIWRVMGVSPAEFTFHEQYGTGTEYPNTIAVEGERVYMGTRHGMDVYDGMNTTPYGKEQIEVLMRDVNEKALDQMCATLFDKRYYLAFPTGDSTVNNAMLIYDLNEGTILYYPETYIESFLPAGDELFATSSTLPGRILKVNYDSWQVGAANAAPARWVTPWMDFGYKRIQKGGFDFYFLPEVQQDAVTFTITVQTEKKKKTKQYVCQPLTEDQLAVPKEHRMKKLHFGGSGRKFRVIIEVERGNELPWRIIGGIQMVVETDPD